MIWAVIGLVATITAIGLAAFIAGIHVGTNDFVESNDVALCSVHHGVLNEDDYSCDFSSLDRDQDCEPVQLYRKR